jgi:enoyl-CoA hydratase/3-hydroxyacyl-CoA dehydrogenase
MAFPETGIGIYPGLGGMLRLARQIGPELAKYYVFTGAPLRAQDAYSLGLIHKLVDPAEVGVAIAELVDAGRPDKYRDRTIPGKLTPYLAIFSPENVERLLEGQPLENVDAEIAAKIAKFVGFKAPLAVKLANEIIDQQVRVSIPDAVELELDRLGEIFTTADALEGLSSAGRKRPEFKGT